MFHPKPLPRRHLFLSFSSSSLHLRGRERETGDSTGGSLSTTDNDRQQAASPGMKTYEQVVISMPAQLKIKRTNWNAYIVSKSPWWICVSYIAMVQIHYICRHCTPRRSHCGITCHRPQIPTGGSACKTMLYYSADMLTHKEMESSFVCSYRESMLKHATF